MRGPAMGRTAVTRPRVVVPIAILAAGVAVVSARRTWLTGRITDDQFGGLASATGTEVVPGLVALALVIAAAAVAAASAGPLLRRVTLIVGAAGAFALAVLSAMVVTSADRLLGGVAAQSSGRTGTVAASAMTTLWPYAVFGAAVLATACFIAGLTGAAAWRGLSQRYEVPAGNEVAGARGQRVVGAWDRLDRGEDPTTEPTSEPPDPARIGGDDLPESDQPEPGSPRPRP